MPSVRELFHSPHTTMRNLSATGLLLKPCSFSPFAPGNKRRLLRYYQLVKQPQQGQTLIALFHPRGEPV